MRERVSERVSSAFVFVFKRPVKVGRGHSHQDQSNPQYLLFFFYTSSEQHKSLNRTFV